MVALGWWQVQVYQTQGLEASAAARERPRRSPWTASPRRDAAVRDGYGRTVTATGSYVPDQQLLIPLPADAPAGTESLIALDSPTAACYPWSAAWSGAISPRPAAGGAAHRGSSRPGVLLPSEERPPICCRPVDSVRFGSPRWRRPGRSA